MKEQFDAVVIGAGQAGVPWAVALADAGRRTAIVERAELGGTCINTGCTPTKTLVASAAAAEGVRRADAYGVEAGPPRLRWDAVQRRRQAVVEQFRSGSERRLTKAGVAVIRGEARFVSPRALEVSLRGGESTGLQADQIFVNTGGRPARPPLRGLDRVEALDSTSIQTLPAVPGHLVILGGGYVALEFAQMFRRFGAQVTVLERSERLLGREEPELSDAVLALLEEDGVRVLLRAQVEEVGPAEAGGVLVRISSPALTLTGTHLLVATGRVPNTESLDARATGLALDGRGFIQVDAHLRTSVPDVFAMGDVTGAPAFTHVSYDDYRILADNLLRGGQRSTAGRQIPSTVFIDPQLGHIGLTEAEARHAGHAVRIARLPMTSVARAIETSQTRGLLKAVVHRESGAILGFSALGMEGGELASVVQTAMLGGLPWTALRDAIFPHPGLAESLNNLFDALED